jgi:nucleoside-diphosphate-sugar epimerase
MTRVFVTGATGFVGLNLLPVLVDSEFQPIAIVRESSPMQRLPAGVETVTADLFEPTSYEDELAQCEAVIHLAATSDVDRGEQYVRRVNVDGSTALAEAAQRANVDEFVFTSTIWAHPESRGSSDVPTPDPYVTSKVDAEQALRESFSSLDPFVVYPTHVVGPRDFRLRRFRPFYLAASNRVLIPPLYVPGKYNLVHVADVVDAIVDSLSNRGSRRTVAAGKTVQSVNYFQCIADNVSGTTSVLTVPYTFHRFGVVPALKLLRKHGLIPDREYKSLQERANVAVPPTSMDPPSEHRSLKRTVADATDWYRKVGLLGAPDLPE